MAKKTITSGQVRLEDKSNLRIKYDIEEIFGISLSGAPGLREALGQAIIDKIVDRSSKGVMIDGKLRGRAAKYSEMYAQSDDFKAAGKNKNKVNLRLTGDMLADVDVLKSKPTEITIGFTDSLESEKAHGHVTGAVGVKRDFFGLRRQDISEIKKEFLPEIKELLRVREQEGKSAFESAVLDLIKDIQDGEG